MNSGYFIITYCTVDCHVVSTAVYAVGIYVVFYHGCAVCMSESRNKGINSGYLITAYGTVDYSVVTTAVYAVGIYVVFYHRCAVCMPNSCNLVRNVAVTTYGTCVGCVTAVLTIGSSYYCVIAVSESSNNILRKDDISAYSTLCTLGKTSRGTSRSLGRNNLYFVICTKILATYVTHIILIVIDVSGCGNLCLLGKYLITYSTSDTVGKTGFSTSRCFSGDNRLCMSKSCNLITNVGVTAYKTNVSSITAVFTVGSNYCRLIAVSDSIGCICDIAITAYRTGVGCVTAVFAVGRSYYCIVIMSESGNFSMNSGYLVTTYGAVNYDIVSTNVFTVGICVIFYHGCGICMTERSYLVCNVAIATY